MYEVRGIDSINRDPSLREIVQKNGDSVNSYPAKACLPSSHIEGRQYETPDRIETELYGLSPAYFTQYFKRCINPVPNTGVLLPISDPVTQSPKETEKKNKLLVELNDRLSHFRSRPYKTEVNQILYEKPVDLVQECLRYHSIFMNGGVCSEIYWGLIAKNIYFNNQKSYGFRRPSICNDLSVAEVIVKALKNTNESLIDIFKSSKVISAEKIISLINLSIGVIQYFWSVAIFKKIELAVYVCWYIQEEKKEFQVNYGDKNFMLIAEFIESVVNMSVKGLVQSFIYCQPVNKIDPTFNDNNQHVKNTIKKQNLEHVDAPDLVEEKFIFGEEYEFAIPLKETSSPAKCFTEIAEKWCMAISLRASNNKIKFTRNKRPQPPDIFFAYLITLGEEFKLKMFRDGLNIEINVVPYRHNQKFPTVGENKKTVYWFLQEFVFSIADELKLERVSGHKHIDIKDSLCGNVELLVRMIVDAQNQSFFPVLLNRMDSECFFSFDRRCYSGIGNFEFPREVDFLAEAINAQLRNKEVDLLKSDFQNTAEFVNMLREIFFYFDKKDSLCNLLHITGCNKAVSIITAPSTTLEFRVMPCPRDAKECKLINTMYIDWFKSLRRDQTNKKLLEHPLRPPAFYNGRPDLARQHFKEFLQRIGSQITEEESEKLIHCT